MKRRLPAGCCPRRLAAGFGLVVVPAILLAAPTAAPAEPSAGCAVARPPPVRESVMVDGRERRFILVPPRNGEGPHPLVVAFHGRTNDNERVRGYYDLEGTGDLDALFVYPAADTDASGRFAWADPGDAPEDLRDYAFFDRLVAVLGLEHCLDLDAIFVVGHSLGASFANSLACARGDVIRGVGSVAGGISTDACRGRVAGLLLHNPSDRLVPLSEGERARDALLAVRPSSPVTETSVGGFDCIRYGEGEPLLWCLHGADRTGAGRHYPHQWPPGAGAAIMEFFGRLVGGRG